MLSSKTVTSRFCIAPLDVIKIRLQLQVSSIADPHQTTTTTTTRPKYHGALSTFKTILREEGITVRLPPHHHLPYIPDTH